MLLFKASNSETCAYIPQFDSKNKSYNSCTTVNAGKTAHFLLNFTLNKIKLAQIMNNRVYFVRNTCYFDVQ